MDDDLAFLCHSSGDKQRVRDLYQRLSGDGVRCWLDEVDLRPGQIWDTEIRKAMRESRYVLVCLSHNSVSKSGYVQKELRQALDLAEEKPLDSTFLIPVLLEQVDIPERLAHLHAADLSSANGYNKLVSSIKPPRGGPAEPISSRLERVLGGNRYKTHTWYTVGLDRCSAVALIEDKDLDGRGTGFLVSGRELHPALPSTVLLTSGHIVPDAVSIEDAVVSFNGLNEPQSFRVTRQCWYDPPSPPGVDTSILELEDYPGGVTPIPIASTMPDLSVFGRSRTEKLAILGKPTLTKINQPGPTRTYIIGHPRGYNEPQFSLDDNALLDYDDRVLHYRTPTEGGSAGSPVFNDQWQLIGIHHAGSFTMSRLHGDSGTYPANEAIAIQAIRLRLADRPPKG